MKKPCLKPSKSQSQNTRASPKPNTNSPKPVGFIWLTLDYTHSLVPDKMKHKGKVF